MARYDRNYDRGYGARRPRIWGRGEEYFEYDEDGGWSAQAGGQGGSGGYDGGMTPARDWVRGGHGLGGQYGGRGYLGGGGQGVPRGYDRGFGRGYDRGVYGGAYPQFGGVPGSPREGMFFGGRSAGGLRHPDTLGAWQPRPWGGGGWAYDTAFRGGFGRGYDRGMGPRGAGHGGDFAREPFMPEAAYLRHPEYETPSTYHQQRWERPGEYVVPREEPLGDDEIRNEVRQRLYQDTWLQADEIDVSVSGGVVTLRGEVHDFLEARYAWDDAWETEGVRGVINNLTVRPDQPGTEHHGDVFAQDTEGGKEGGG
jgi:hypothetical protein